MAPGLLVPVDVEAFCIGDGDAAAARLLAGATANFEEQWTPARQAFLGANVSIDFNAPPLEVLDRGVHLHWALPDALTRAATGSGSLAFPAVPDRWLVTRIAVQHGQPSTRSWLIESDAVLEQPPTGQTPITVPVKPGTFGDQDFGYLGRRHDIDEAWDATNVTPALRAVEATGNHLSAVSNGELSFAAYYPSCKSVFGFHDDLRDLDPPSGQSIGVTYAVAGWYSDASVDIVQPGATLGSIEGLGWTYTGTGTPAFSLCHGLAQDIAWNPDHQYLPATQPAVEVSAAIGTTPAEALAAYFAQTNHPDIPLAEQLLDAFQLDLLDGFTQPAPDRLVTLSNTLHDRGFARAAADAVFAVVVPDPTAGKDAVKELVGLPPALAADLNALNDLQSQFEQGRRQLDELRWTLFADWYRIFEANSDTYDAAVSIAEQRVETWDELQPSVTALEQALTAARAKVQAQLTAPQSLAEVAGQEFIHPADPAVMLIGEGVGFPERHGGDGRFDAHGRLVCRLTNDLLTGVTTGGKTVAPSDFSGVAAPAGLPNTDLLTAVLQEACALDTGVLAAATGVGQAALDAALPLALAGEPQQTLTLTGTPPSPVAVTWLEQDDWLPLFLGWSASWLPFHDTTTGPYAPTTVTGGFALTAAGGVFTPEPGGPDPSQSSFPQHEGLSGVGHLTPRSAETFRDRLHHWLESQTDATLQAIHDELASSQVVTASLAGFTDLLMMRRHGIQLPVRVPDSARADIQQLTQAIAAIVGNANAVGPALLMPFNPLRAGYLRVELQLVDAYGRKRPVKSPQLLTSQSLTATTSTGQAVPSTAYLAPRLSQPSRLAFRWLAADGTGLDEMNDHPATTPICGWLQPNRLDGSLFVYAASGSALGQLYLQQTASGAQVRWQSAPGDDTTIGEDVEQALAHASPRLLELATALRRGSADFFTGLWHVIDTMADTIEGGTPPSNAGLAQLVGRPIGVAESLLRVELAGAPRIDVGFSAFQTDTDDGFGDVELPVVLGDIGQLGDGLIGFFGPIEPGGTYPFDTFYTQGADGNTPGIVTPGTDTITLAPTPVVDPAVPADVTAATRTVLMLLDPMAPVHAATGVLPTGALQLPADQVGSALSTLDMSFFTAPVLGGASELVIPTPSQPGYGTSWVQAGKTDQGDPTWLVTPKIGDPAGRVVWAYTPQTAREGWLRLNPLVLEFRLAGTNGQPVVLDGHVNDLTLTVVNAGQRAAVFRAGAAVPEGVQAPGSVFYLHLAAIVAPANADSVDISAPGWTFTPYTNAAYGTYWAATADTDTTVAPGDTLTAQISLTVSSSAARAQVPFDYYGVDGLDDGVYVETVAVQATTAIAR